MNRNPKITLRVIGAVALLCAAFGLWYNACTLEIAFAGKFTASEEHNEIPFFDPAFYVMSTVCIGCYVLLVIFGIQFMRGRTAHVRAFTSLLIFEVVYFILISLLWLVPGIGMSVGAATGVANGGLMAQFLIVFPLWAPPLAGWAHRHSLLPPSDPAPSQ